MFHNYLITALRNFTRHKLYSFINIAGLTVGLTCAIFIILFVRDELSYDRWIPGDRESLSRGNRWFRQLRRQSSGRQCLSPYQRDAGADPGSQGSCSSRSPIRSVAWEIVNFFSTWTW